jgi:hypothetical protein
MLQAIEVLYNSIGGGLPTLWLDEIPENQGYPRATLTDGGRVPTLDSYADGSPTEVFGTFSIMFKVEDDSDVVEALAVTLMTAFTPQAIQLTFDPLAVMMRVNDVVTGTGERSPDDKPIYEAKIDYRVELSPPY